jgi:Spy/CpxP family protein refolding chaperone
MRVGLTVAAVLLCSITAVAQNEIKGVSQTQSPALTTGSPAAAGFPFAGGFKPPDGLLDEFWNDPAYTSELHLTDSQRKQLQEAMLAERLSLIDRGADCMKALLRLSAILEAEPFDDAAYKKQMDELSASAGKAVGNLGELVATRRRVLTAEQWTKLRSLQHTKRQAAVSAAVDAATNAAAPTGAKAPPRVPSSLLQPLGQ